MSHTSLQIRALNMTSLEKVFDLHCAILRSLPDKAYLYTKSQDFSEAVIGGDGVIVGAFSGEEKLVG